MLIKASFSTPLEEFTDAFVFTRFGRSARPAATIRIPKPFATRFAPIRC
jgi:hypothetical protein